jgi:hypothetical protein
MTMATIRMGSITVGSGAASAPGSIKGKCLLRFLVCRRKWGLSARHTRSGISPARPTMLYKPQTGAAKSMTYCGGILVREGLVMFADTRTNAGVDNIIDTAG